MIQLDTTENFDVVLLKTFENFGNQFLNFFLKTIEF